ncbi:MAG: penicillin-binding protein 2 [candidate division Zixibacteria bacterium]|nr:penicillin-binding protein 2 [candidate division Zixibacteria bacterium]
MTEQLEKRYAQGAKLRLKILFALAGIFWAVLIVRLFQLQVLEAHNLRNRSDIQSFWQVTRPAPRGTIYDRRGVKLSFNLPGYSFFAVPDSVSNPRVVASRFSNMFRKPYAPIYESLNSKRDFVWLKRGLDQSQAQEIQSWKLKGVFWQEEPKRANSAGDLAQVLLGLTDVDNRGISGLELYYESDLAGKDGKSILQKDALGRTYDLSSKGERKIEPGNNLVLTIDSQLQWILENRIKEGVAETGSKSGFGILMDPNNGEILALAILFGENASDQDRGRIKPVTDQYEPGSTMKLFTAAAALETRVKSPGDLLYAENGSWNLEVGKHVLHDIHPYQELTFQEAFAYSSNIAVAKVGLELGAEKLYKYLRNFGFGFKTGIDLPAEAEGVIQPYDKWTRLNLISNSIGYGISATPLQMLCGYAAVANGGTLYKPYLVKAIIDEKGNLLKENRPSPVRSVIKPETAEILKDFLISVVEEGTGTLAKVEGVELAGKTGTARKINQGSKGYQKEYLSSFIGFFPVSAPRYAGIIILDSPQGKHYGGETAAPVFREVVKDILSLPSVPTHKLLDEKSIATYGTAGVQAVAVKIQKEVGEKRID